MKVAAAYLRKSTDEGDKSPDAKSVARQRERAEQFATSKGWRLDDRYVYVDDGISGSEFVKRPGLQRLLAACDDPPFEALIVMEQSRLGRDTVRTLALIQRITDSGVQIWTYDGKPITLDDEDDEVTTFIHSWASAAERRRASTRTRDAMRRNFSMGRSVGGRVYGYRLLDGKRVVEPTQAAVIKRIFTAYAEGDGFHKIARALEHDHVPSPRGKAGWSNTQVGVILNNEIYRGVLTWGRTKQVRVRGTGKTVASPDATLKLVNEDVRIVDDRLWNAVRVRAKQMTDVVWRRPSGQLLSRPTTSKWLLSPFLACGLCGGSMHVRNKSVGTPHPVYFCTNRHLKGQRGCKNARGLRVDFADNFVMKAFEEALAANTVLTILEEALEARRQAAADPTPLRRELKRLQAEVRRYTEAIAHGGDIKEVVEALNVRKERIAALERQLAGVETVTTFDLKGEFNKRLAPVLTDWRAAVLKPLVAQQVLRKLLPTRLRATPGSDGSWTVEGDSSLVAVLKEANFDAVIAALEAAGLVNGAGRDEYKAWKAGNPSVSGPTKSSRKPRRRRWHRWPRRSA